MTSLRDEAQNPNTSPERLYELINLPGNRGQYDCDAGWHQTIIKAST